MRGHARWFFLFVLLNLISIFLYPSTSYAARSWLRFVRKNTLLNTYMRAYAVSRDKLYVGTFGDGLVIYTGTQTRNVTAQNTRASARARVGLISDYITALCLDERNGRLWIGTIEGLSSSNLDATDWRTFTTKDGLPNNVIRDIAIDAEGRVWVGTPSGVAVFDGQEWKTHDTRTGLRENSVHALKVQGDTVWVASVGGAVSRLKNGEWKLFLHR